MKARPLTKILPRTATTLYHTHKSCQRFPMSNVNTIALRSALFLGAIVAILVALRSCEFETLKITESTPTPAPQPTPTPTPAPPREVVVIPRYTPTPTPRPTPPIHVEQENEPPPRPVVVRTPPPVRPTPQPDRIMVYVTPNKWSELVNIPRGKRGRFGFILKRMQVELDGREIKTVERNPIFQQSDRNPNALRIRPFAIFEDSAREMTISPDVRTIRFKSLTKESDNITIFWED